MENMQESKFNSSVFWQILAVILAFSLLILLSSMFMDDIESRHMTNGMESALNDTEININADLKELETLLHYISETIRIMVLDGSSFDMVAHYITNVTEYIMTSDERLREYTTGVYGHFDVFDGRFHHGTGWIPVADYVPEDRPWHKVAVQANGRVNITEPYVSMAYPGTHTLTFTRRIFDKSGVPLGVIGLDVLLERVQGFTTNAYFGEGGYGFLLNQRLEILAHPESDMLGTPLRDIHHRYIPLVDDLEQGIPVIERRMKNYKDEMTRVSFRQLENGWHIGMVITEDAYFKELKRMRLIFIAVGVALAGMFIVIILRLSAVNQELQIVKDSIALGDREQEIFDLLLTELSIKQIADKLELSQAGVNFHIRKIYRKLGIQSRTELLAKFVK